MISMSFSIQTRWDLKFYTVRVCLVEIYQILLIFRSLFLFRCWCVVNYSIICMGRLQGVTWKHSCVQVRMWLNDSKMKCCLGWLLTNSLNSGLLVTKSFVKHYLMNMFFICNKKPEKRKRNGKMKRYSFKFYVSKMQIVVEIKVCHSLRKWLHKEHVHCSYAYMHNIFVALCPSLDMQQRDYLYEICHHCFQLFEAWRYANIHLTKG